MSSLSLAQIGITFIVAIIAYFSFYYGRKPLIQVKTGKIDDYEFIIKNVSKNPAKNIIAEIKLEYKEEILDIGKYELNYLNPEAEDFIKGISEKIESKIEEKNILIKSPYEWPINPESFFLIGNFIEQINAIENYKKDELQTLYSHKINNDFKISIKFKVTCNSDIPFNIPLFNRHTFLYNFEISYTKYDLDYLSDIEQEECLKISSGYIDNYYLRIHPSSGEWK